MRFGDRITKNIRSQYHIVFAPKYRRKAIYGKLKADIGKIIRKLCDERKVELIEAEACPDHIHMPISIPPYMSVSQFVGCIKSKSALMIFDRSCESEIQIWAEELLGERIFC